MNQKIALILSAAVTAFVLVVGGAIIGKVSQPGTASLTPDAAELQAIYAQREAEYQARLAEANAALSAMYARQETAATPGTVQARPATVPATLSPQDAMLVAAMAAPRATILRLPELVNYQGTVAYEVALDAGMMYIDANSGQVLYNGTTQPQNSVQTRTFNDNEHHEDHEEEHDD